MFIFITMAVALHFRGVKIYKHKHVDNMKAFGQDVKNMEDENSMYFDNIHESIDELKAKMKEIGSKNEKWGKYDNQG